MLVARHVRGAGLSVRGAQALKVAYVTVQFPVPSETFATHEVRVLSSQGVVISVHGLRPEHRDARELASAREVDDVETTHNSFRASVRGAMVALQRPALFLRAVSWIVRANLRNARDVLLSLLLLPRAFDILTELEAKQPQIVHLYWGHFPSIVGFLVQRRLPHIVTSISFVAYDLKREYGGSIEVARQADVVRTHASVNVDQVVLFTGIARERVQVIFDGVDVTWIERLGHGIDRVPRRLVATGRLIPDKGMDDVVTAFAGVHARWPDSTLVIAGDGPDRDRLVAMCDTLNVSEAVKFVGHVAHSRVIQEMARAESFLLLSRYGAERLPNVVKEAMASRCLCITTPTRGIEELVEHGVSGFVVPMSAPEAVTGIVHELFSGQLDAASIAERGADHVRRCFDVFNTAPQYTALWRAAIDTRGGGPRASSGAGGQWRRRAAEFDA